MSHTHSRIVCCDLSMPVSLAAINSVSVRSECSSLAALTYNVNRSTRRMIRMPIANAIGSRTRAVVSVDERNG